MIIKRRKKNKEEVEELNLNEKASKRYRKISIKKIILIITVFLIPLFLLGVYFVFRPTIENKLEKKGYSRESISYFVSKEIADEIIDKTYSKTLDEAIGSNKYVEKNLEYYLAIEYLEEDNFIETINTLIEKGYTVEELKKILAINKDSRDLIKELPYSTLIIKLIDERYSNDNSIIATYKNLIDKTYNDSEIEGILKLEKSIIEIVINHEKVEGLSSYFDIKYFKKDNFNRYLSYSAANKGLSVEDIITRVNANLDYSFYTNTKEVSNYNDLLVLVNKYNSLPSSYTPGDLEKIDNKYNPYSLYLRHDAKVAFEKMCEDALKENLYVLASSTYRSYSSQKSIYNNYVSRDGKAAADRYSARAGFSEHQTGLAVDVKTNSKVYTSFEYTKEFTWMKNNSYKYGFILRYPEGKENITGYMYESWHYRYVGKDVATIVYNNNITYDEYCARFN